MKNKRFKIMVILFFIGFIVALGVSYDIKKLFDVSRNCFIPKPNVDSIVISLIKSELNSFRFSDNSSAICSR